ncbi:MAG: HlyC/CorC family transporter [Nitrospinae bacterium]|nr:HlyC/CorC family transporter [Nitrospinota bacterium]
MDDTLVIRWALLPVLLAASAFFSGSEVAFFSLSKLQIERLKETRGFYGKWVAALLTKPERLLVTLYIGNELVNVAISAVVTYLALESFDDIGVALMLGASAFILLVIGEISPKTLAHYANETWALTAAAPLTIFLVAIYPVQIIVTWISNGISSMFGGKTAADNFALTGDEIKTLVEEVADEGVIDEAEKEMIQSVFDLGDLMARDIMTPRTDLLALDVNMPLKEAWDKMAQSSFARAPVYNGTIDNIEGVLYKKDFLKYDYPPDPVVSLKSLLREPVIVPETLGLNDLLREFKRRKSHMAVIMDEFGGIQGIVTLDDIIAELMGETASRKSANGEIVEKGEGIYIIPAALSMEDFNERFNADVGHEEIETLGGFVFHLLGHVPHMGESVVSGPFTFTVERMKGRRATELKVAVAQAGAAEPEGK